MTVYYLHISSPAISCEDRASRISPESHCNWERYCILERECVYLFNLSNPLRARCILQVVILMDVFQLTSLFAGFIRSFNEVLQNQQKDEVLYHLIIKDVSNLSLPLQYSILTKIKISTLKSILIDNLGFQLARVLRVASFENVFKRTSNGH